MSGLSLTNESRIAATKEQVTNELAGEAVILNLKTGIYFGLNPVGARIWQLIQQPTTVHEVMSALLAEYDVEAARLEADLRSLLAQLSDNQLIETA
jgi:hypothetical protein